MSSQPQPALTQHSTELPEPWFRTIYEEESENKNAFLFSAAGRLASTALMAQTMALNTAVQFAAGSVRLGASATRKATAALPGGFIPFQVASDIAQRVENRARDIATRSSEIARHDGVTLSSTPGSANKIAADMILGPVASVAGLPVTTAGDALAAVSNTQAGGVATEALTSAANRAMDALSVSSAPTVLDTLTIRQTWLSMTTGPGKTSLANIVDFAGAMLRLSVGDTRSLASVLQTTAVDFNYGYQYGVNDVLYPKVPIGTVLADLSGLIVRYLPATYISALRTGDLWKTANASVEDGEGLMVSVASYPVGLILVVANIGRFLAMGLRDCNDVEMYLRREQEIVARFPELATMEGVQSLLRLDPEDAAKSNAILALADLQKLRPFTCTEFEYYVGNAKSIDRPEAVARGLLSHPFLPVGVFPQDLIDLAQDTAFWYSSRLLGREAALVRVTRLFGETVRGRLAADPSLEHDGPSNRQFIDALVETTQRDPRRVQDLKAAVNQKIASIDRLEANPDIPVPRHTRMRRQYLAELLASLDAGSKARVQTSGEETRGSAKIK